jgi:hypothetical protein
MTRQPSGASDPDDSTPMRRALTALRDAPWLDGDRAYVMARAAVIGLAVGVAALVLTGHGGADRNGTAPGGDFIVYWVAAGLAAAGHAADAYLPALVSAAEHRSVVMPDAGFLPFYYPPVWLVVLLAFAALPYVWAWLAFCGASGAVFLLAIRRLLPAGGRGMWLAMMGFPGLLVNAGNGQNGFFTASCFAGYGLLLDRAPLLAGSCLGLLCVKPQFALVVPVALLAARRARPICGAACGVAAPVLASLALFGMAPWRGFLAALPTARHMFETQLLSPFKLMSVLGGLRMLGVWGAPAYGVQLAVAVAALLCLGVLAARRPGGGAEAALLGASALLVTPYAMDYDLPVAAVAMAVVFAAGARGGFLPWEKTVLLAAYVLPLVGPAIARFSGLPIGPAVLGALFLVSCRRAAHPGTWPGGTPGPAAPAAAPASAAAPPAG